MSQPGPSKGANKDEHAPSAAASTGSPISSPTSAALRPASPSGQFGRMAGLSASVSSLSLLQLVNAVGHDYGSAPAPRDEEEVSEVLADSETAPFSPSMLEQSITYASSPAADHDVSNEQQVQQQSSPAGPAGSRPARPAASPLSPRASVREERQLASAGDLDPMASSIHAIHRQQDSPTTPFRQQSQHPPQASADNEDEDLDERVLSRAERRAVLAEKLQEVFGLAEKEEVVAEFQAFLLRSVLLQGFLYLTSGHICFYAYLSEKEGKVLRSGSLSKRASKTRRYKQHWFVLRNDVFSWYPSSTEPYFPNGDVSLYYVTSVESSAKNPRRFKVLTANRRLLFMAESQAARDDWVRALNKAVFQSQTEGDTVKISIPLETVLSVERTALDFVDALTVRVFDNESSSCGDTYPFCYLSNMQAAHDRLKALLEEFRASHPDLAPQVVQNNAAAPGDGVSASASQTQQTSTAATPLARSQIDVSRSNAPFSDFLSADNGARRPSATRRASVETITTATAANPTEVPSGASSTSRAAPIPMRAPHLSGSAIADEHTYPPDSPVSTPPDDATLDKAATALLWPIPTWVRSAPKLMSSVPLPTISSFTRPAASSSRRITEVLSSASRIQPSPPSEPATLAQDSAGATDKDPDDDIHSIFLLSPTEALHHAINAYTYRGLPIYGRLYLTTKYVCFKSKNFISGTRMILPLQDVIAAQISRAYRFGYFGLILIIKGHEELFFEIGDKDSRDTFQHLLEQQVDFAKESPEANRVPTALEEVKRLQELQTPTVQAEGSASPPSDFADVPAIMFHSQSSSFLDFKPQEKMHFVCLTIGSRGDVQPYIALCKGLLAEGHRCTIASHPEYRTWVESYGIGYKEVGGDPAELMRICVDNGMFTVSFLKEGLSKFRGWLDDLLQTSWQACQDADVLIESPSAMSGLHIAEALQIPYFRAFTMPWTKTRAYPHAFAVPDYKLGGQYNYLSYTMFDSVFWRSISGQINKWRRETLKLPATNAEKMEQSKVPFLYNLSPSLMPPPLDWPEWVHVTGYWFLDNPDPAGTSRWTPPDALLQFMDGARQSSKKLVYIGFGSIVVPDPEALTQTVNEAVSKAGVCAIVSKGWSNRLAADLRTEEDKAEFNAQQAKEKQMLSRDIYTVDAIPHDWLFPRIDAACHHGGSGTTGASLRAGIPTIVRPFFGDQFFQADRMEALGVGTCLKKLTVDSLSRALHLATSEIKQIKRAQLIGQEIRKEDGVANAIEMIYRDMEYARTLVKRRAQKDAQQSETDQQDDPSRSLSRESFHHVSSEERSDHVGDHLSEDSWDHLSHASDVLSRSAASSVPSRSDDSDSSRAEDGGRQHRSRSGSVLSRARSASRRMSNVWRA